MGPRSGSSKKNKAASRAKPRKPAAAADSEQTSPLKTKVVFNLKQNQIAQFDDSESPHTLADLLKKHLIVSDSDKETSDSKPKMQSPTLRATDSTAMPIKSALSKKSLGSGYSSPSNSISDHSSNPAHDAADGSTNHDQLNATDTQIANGGPISSSINAAANGNPSTDATSTLSKNAKKRIRKRKKLDGQTFAAQQTGQANDDAANNTGGGHVDTQMDTGPDSEPEIVAASKKLIISTEADPPAPNSLHSVATRIARLPETLRKDAMSAYIKQLNLSRLDMVKMAGELSRLVAAVVARPGFAVPQPHIRPIPQSVPVQPPQPTATATPDVARQSTQTDMHQVTSKPASPSNLSANPTATPTAKEVSTPNVSPNDHMNTVWRHDSKIDVDKPDMSMEQCKPHPQSTPSVSIPSAAAIRSSSYQTPKSLVFDVYLKNIRAQDVLVKMISDHEAHVYIESIDKSLRITFAQAVYSSQYKISTGMKIALEFPKIDPGVSSGDAGSLEVLDGKDVAPSTAAAETVQTLSHNSTLYTSSDMNAAFSYFPDKDDVSVDVTLHTRSDGDGSNTAGSDVAINASPRPMSSSTSFQKSADDIGPQPISEQENVADSNQVRQPLVPVYMKRLSFEDIQRPGTPDTEHDADMDAGGRHGNEARIDDDTENGDEQHGLVRCIEQGIGSEVGPSLGAPQYDYLKRGTHWCGLINEGVDCFINNIVQCLASIPNFTHYFLSDIYRDHINTENPISNSKGAIANAFAVLLSGLATEPRAFVPVHFKCALEKFWALYDPYTQQDAQEFLNYLLDAIHEDVNKIQKKPYIELPDYDNSVPDVQIATEYWDAHKKRNDSIIVDTFQGQYKSQIVCETCQKSSIKFDAFMNLTMEIPSVRFDFEFVFVPLIGPKQRVVLSLEPNATMAYVRERLGRITCTNPGLVYPFLIANRAVIERIIGLAELAQSFLLASRHNAHVAFYETVPNRAYVLLSHLFSKRDARFGGRGHRREHNGRRTPMRRRRMAAGPVPSVVTQATSSAESSPPDTDLDGEIDHSAHPKISDQNDHDGGDQRTCDMIENDEEENNNNENNGGGYEDVDDDDDGDDGDDDDDETRPSTHSIQPFGWPSVVDVDPGVYTLRELYEAVSTELIQREILTRLDVDAVINSTVTLFDLRARSEDDYDSDDKVTIEENSTFHSLAFWKNARHLEFFSDDANEEPETTFRDEPSPEGVLLDDCIAQHLKQEVVDEWYCGNCKKHTRGLKKLDLWSLPDILIVHLKRFVLHPRLQSWTKLDSHVAFPLNHFRLGRWGVNPAERNKTYRLFAVSNHRGGTEHGHYTAFCKRQDEWYHFDDETVLPVDADRVVTQFAYVLFYQRDHGDQGSVGSSRTSTTLPVYPASSHVDSGPCGDEGRDDIASSQPALMRDSSPVASEVTVSPTETVPST